ncbi:MAG: PSD1 and planctomycete cytochrome C domain-containing protein [Bryobacteraceae bacterium]
MRPIAALICCSSALLAEPNAEGVRFFESTVQPILRANCIACHTDKNPSSGLSLESQQSILRGGNRGPAPKIIGEAIRQTGDLKMPPGSKLSAEKMAALEKWVADGLPMPDALLHSKRPGADHWSFRVPQRAVPPPVRDMAWGQNPIDRFILAKIEKAGLKPSAVLEKAKLLRRVSLDLTGLPPSPPELQDFLADTRPDAYERVVDRLLASPHYGERWGRHWLDVARYADSDGYAIDAPRQIWKYRDWVIQALNRDMPFDRFVVEQMAGDLLPEASTDQLIATGFHRNTPSNQEGGIDFEQYRVEAVVDRVSTTGTAFLGLTVGCARCHDHKYDPVSQREFYRLFAFFNNSDEIDHESKRQFFNRPFLELPTPTEQARQSAYTAQLKALEAELAAFRKTGTIPDDDPALKEREANLKAIKSRAPVLTSTLVMKELPEPRPAYIHLAGDFTRKGAAVEPGVPAILPALDAKSPRPTRLDLARWLVDRRNPLTARVTVNRMWQKFFGRGIVATEDDFGTQGEKPTHPELLDWLAVEFMENGWSQKNIHLLIVTSATYRQDSRERKDISAADPENRLLARQNRLRLDAEIVRDASLVASGLLAPKVGGPGVYPPQPDGVYQVTQIRREWKPSTGEDRYRRGMYTFFQRTAPHPSLVVFDAPDATASCTRRMRSNTPLQALAQLNDEGAVEFAAALAQRMRKESATEGVDGDKVRLRQGYLLALNREPRAEETARLLRFVAAQRDSKKDPWVASGQVLLNLDEFLTRP